MLIGGEKKYHGPSSIVAKKTSDMSPLRGMVKKKPLEVRVWINFKFAFDQPHSFSQPLKVVNDGARSQSSIPVMHEEYS